MDVNLKFFLVISILSLFYACNGQVKTKTSRAQPKQITAGQVVQKLDSKATIMYQDQKDNYWFASKGIGLYKYDGSKLVLFSKADSLVSLHILAVQEDESGNIYVDTPGGIASYDGSTWTTLEVAEEEDPLWTAQPTDLWFSMGWDKKGPYRYDGELLHYLPFPKNKMEDDFYAQYPNLPYSAYGIYEIVRDRKGGVWFGTASMGIYHFDGQKLGWMYEKRLTETPEGGDFGIRSIAEDKDGYLWICNTEYKYKILPDGPKEEQPYDVKYIREPGIKKIDPMYYMSVTTTANGDLWMVTFDDGVWRYNGTELKHYPIKEHGSDVLLADIRTDNYDQLWLGTRDNGTYAYDGETFKKYTLK